jgi:hypothetical protein
MTWFITGRVLEACSCKMFCPCVMGPADPTFGWCAVAILYDIRSGEADGVKLDGCKVFWTAVFPRYFGDGNGVSRLYIDETADPEQREKLESLWKGQRGGPPAIINALTSQWLSSQVTRIGVQEGDKTSFTVGAVGMVILDPVKNEQGEITRVENAPAWGPQGLRNEAIAHADGSYIVDPEMRRWVSGGFGAMQTFSWAGE